MKISILNINSEIGAGTRGASLGCQALKIASWKKGSSYFSTHSIQEIENENQFIYNEIDTPNALRIEGVYKECESISNAVAKELSKGNTPIVLAGDHSTAAGTIAGIKMAYPKQRLGVVWIDAHADLHSPFTSPSGNVHGMPLAASLNMDNNTSTKEIQEKSKQYWNKLKSLGGIKPKVTPEDLIFFGVRSIEKPEKDLINNLNIRNFTVEETRQNTAAKSANKALKLLEACDKIYLSFDVDSLDPDIVSHGTGTPVPNGFRPEEALDLINAFIASGKVCCFEMVEINPTLDEKKNVMAETAFDILEKITKKWEEVLGVKTLIPES